MNNKGQILEDINPAYVGLAIVAGMIAFAVATYADSSKFIAIMSGLGAIVVTYFYLVFTDR